MSVATPVEAVPQGHESTERTPSARAMWLILAVVLLADALDLLDSTITNIAAPTVVEDIGGGQTLVKWLSAAYALALGSLLVVGGRLGDRYGRRRLFLTGLVGFTLAFALCGIAWDPTVLISFRGLQGAFGALLIPQGMAIMTKTFPREMLRTAFSAFGPLVGIAAIGGPVLAGFVIDADIAGLGWRPMFLVNIVLGALALLVALRVIPRDDGDPAVKVDLLGSLLLGVAMLTLLYGLIDGSSDGWTSLPIACLVAAAGFFAAFARRLTTAAAPLIQPALLRNRGFASGLVMGLLYFAAFNGLAYVASLFMQLGLHYDPSRASLGLLPVTLGIIVGSGAGMGLIGELGRILVLVGLLVTLAGAGTLLAVVATSGLDVSWWQLSLALLTVGAGAGICFGTIFDFALGDVDPDQAGAASGSVSAIQQIAAAIGSASVTSVYFAVLDPSGQVDAMTTCLAVVIAIAALSLGAVRLLPQRAAPQQHASK
jgi:EmrB/QacA subfamily drug resistance transporter